MTSSSDTLNEMKPITHYRVLALAMPILLSNATVPLLGAVDTAVAGRIAQAEPLAAVGVGAIVIASVYWLFGFLRMGTTGMAAQAVGQGDHAENNALLLRGLLIAMVGAACSFALVIPFAHFTFGSSDLTPDVSAMAWDYVGIRIFSAPAAIGLYAIIGWLFANERMRDVLYIQLLQNGINIVLDPVLALGLGWGIQGLATASLIAEWSGFALGLWMCRAALPKFVDIDWPLILDRSRLKRMASVNRDILLRSVLLQAVVYSFVVMGGRFGTTTLAANHVLMQFLEIAVFALDGLAFGAESLVGQAKGARDKMKLRRAAYLTSFWAAIVALVMALIFGLGGQNLIALMSKDITVRDTAMLYLPWLVALPLTSVGAFMLDGIFIGATQTRDMRNMMFVSAGLYAALIVPFTNLWGNHGLWLVLHICMITRCLTLLWKYPSLERDVIR